MNQSAQLDSSLVYTKENRKNDVGLDDEDKELLFDQTENLVDQSPIDQQDEVQQEQEQLQESPSKVPGMEDVSIPVENLIIFQEQRVEEDQSVQDLNVAVVMEPALGD